MNNRLGNIVKLAKRPPPPVGTTPSRVVHHENKWRLLRYEPRPEGIAYRTPILLVPSLINRHYVLDLLPGKSFAEWFVQQGFDVFAIDWGTPSDEDRFVTFDDVCDTALGRAIRLTGSFGADGRAHVLGYCLGGTLATIHAAARPEHVASLTLLASPVRFSDDGLLARWTRTKSFDVKVAVDAFGLVPWQLLQSAFHLIRPTLSASKLVHVLDRAWDDESMDGFLALEAWGNDNVSFPGACYERYLTALYREDQLWKGSFALSGIPARLEAITAPLHVLTFQHDAIVPHESATCILEKAGSEDKVHVHLPGGHVGAVVSKSASTRLWPQLARFWAERDARTPLTSLRRGAATKAEAPAALVTQAAPVAAVAPQEAEAPKAVAAPKAEAPAPKPVVVAAPTKADLPAPKPVVVAAPTKAEAPAPKPVVVAAPKPVAAPKAEAPAPKAVAATPAKVPEKSRPSRSRRNAR